MRSLSSTRSMAKIAMVAAVYVVLSLVFAPVSYGLIQFRIAEALVMLCVFSADMIWAVTLGCGVANFIGFMTGLNPIPMDIILGTLATLLAGIITYKLRNIRLKKLPILAMLPPIIINGLVIGAEITWLETGKIFANMTVLRVNIVYIAICEIIPCVIGLGLVLMFEKTGIAKKYLND